MTVSDLTHPDDAKTLPESAIRYALARCWTDPDYRWLMLGTETMARLLRALSVLTDAPESELEVVYSQDRQLSHSKRRPEVLDLRDRCERLERLLRASDIPVPAEDDR